MVEQPHNQKPTKANGSTKANKPPKKPQAKNSSAQTSTQSKKSTMNKQKTSDNIAPKVTAAAKDMSVTASHPELQNEVRNEATGGLSPTSPANVSAEKTIVEEGGIWRNFVRCYQKYFTFSGRASRYEYFSFTLTYYLISLFLGILSAVHPFFAILTSIFLLLSIIPTFAVMNRRLHDTGKNLWTGYFNWIIYGSLTGIVIGFVVFYLVGKGQMNQLNLLLLTFLTFLVISGLATAVRFFVYVCRRGQTQENRYGNVPALNNPKSEKSALKIIIVYFTTVFTVTVLGGVLNYFEQVDQQKRLSQTQVQLSGLEQYIHYIGMQEGNYSWLDNGVALRQPLIPDEMFTEDKQGIVTALGLPLNLYGFTDMFVISLYNVDKTDCEAIASTGWPFNNVDEMMIRNDHVSPQIQETLTHPYQCNVCEDEFCEIFWKIK